MFIRKAISLLIFFQAAALGLFAQRIIDSIKICELPVRDGVVFEYDPAGRCTRFIQWTSILTKCDSVFHFEEGKIVAIHNYGSDETGEYGIIIRNKKGDFISYSNLKSVSLKKGDVVKKATWLGLAGISEDGNEKQVDFIFLKHGKQLPFRKEVEYIRCKISCEPQEGYTL